MAGMHVFLSVYQDMNVSLGYSKLNMLSFNLYVVLFSAILYRCKKFPKHTWLAGPKAQWETFLHNLGATGVVFALTDDNALQHETTFYYLHPQKCDHYSMLKAINWFGENSSMSDASPLFCFSQFRSFLSFVYLLLLCLGSSGDPLRTNAKNASQKPKSSALPHPTQPLP